MPLSYQNNIFLNTQKYFSSSLLLLLMSICFMPLILNILGFDFSSKQIDISTLDLTNGQIKTDDLFYAVSGGLHHALMEWSAVVTAFLATLISFFHYSVKRDITIPIIGMAMFSAGMVDAFHTLAATRIISANAPNVNFIPFTWAISRIFNAAIVITGILLCMWIIYKAKSTNRVISEVKQRLQGQVIRPTQFAMIALVSIVFIGAAYFMVHEAAIQTHLPQTMFINSLIKRPYDIAPLLLFIIGGWLALLWYKQNRSVVRFALALSLIPEVAVQLYMAFGSTALFDNSFNIAHFLKIIAYTIVFFGLVYDLVHSVPLEIKKQQFAINQHAIVSVTDVKGTIQYVNTKFQDISGYSREELIGCNHRILNSNAHNSEFFESMYKDIFNGKVWTAEICNRAKDGSLYWVDSTIVPFINEAGRPYQFISIRTDITNKKINELKLLEARNDAIDAVRSKSDFFASMSHEIRTPMNGVLGMLNLMMKTDLNKQQVHYATLAKSSADSLLVIINDILDLSKIQASKIDLEMMDFNLRELLGSLSESLGYKAQDKGLEVILDVTDIEQSVVNGDPVRIRQIVSNLVGNAIKFTEQGEILIQAKLVKGKTNKAILTGTITDTGIGIPSEKIDDLFNTYSQVDSSTTRKFGGTGLGLAIVKELSELMNGDVKVYSDFGQGTTFVFNIELSISQQSKQVLPENNLADISILLVDDNITNLSVLEKQFKKWGAKVYTAVSGENALEIISDPNINTINLAIIDLDIPGTSSIELAQQLRKQLKTKICRFVMMTSMAGSAEISQLKENNFSAYFPKPATTSDLFLALEVLNEVPSDDSVEPNQAPELMTTNRFSNANILLVEDNLVNQEVAVGVLEDMGVKVCVANNGIEAIEILKQDSNKFGLVLMDCQMPKMDGYEATKEIRLGNNNLSNKKIPIVAMTANALKGDRQRCLEAGMDDYLTKPVDPNELEEKLRLWLPKEQQDHHQKAIDLSALEENKSISVNTNENALEKDKLRWDKSGLLKRVRNNEKLAIKLVLLFSNDLPNLLRDLKQNLMNFQPDKVGDIAHRIKGSAANLSAITIASLAAEIEKNARDNQLELVNQQIDLFANEVALLLELLTEFSESKELN